ncbi:MAG: hypothetical protein VKP57_09835 [Candidatus Sericytochromatia bacterium]|nr:hypothetical protein [Candidatus Sericytochromatia bacterium]
MTPHVDQGTGRVAFVRVTPFGLSACRRLLPEADGPAVLAAHPRGQALVLECDDDARESGVRAGMTVAQARQRLPGLSMLIRSPEAEHEAREVLRQTGFGFSPHVALEAPDGLWISVGRLAPPFMDERHWATRLHEALRVRGLANCVGLSRNRPLALLASLAGPGVHVIPPGEEARWAMAMPLSRLPLAPEAQARLASWGFVTLGEVAALPPEALAVRLGPEATRLASFLQYDSPSPPWAADPVPHARERRFRCEDGWVVTRLDELQAVLAPLLTDMVQDMTRDDRALRGLTLTLGLEPRGEHLEHWHFPEPLSDARALLAAMTPVLERHPPAGGVTDVRIVAEEAPRPWAQGHLFVRHQPAPAAFGATLARLGGLLGTQQAGSPRPDPVRRPGQWLLAPFRRNGQPHPGRIPSAADPSATNAPPAAATSPATTATDSAELPASPRLALALWRPPRPLEVVLEQGRPRTIHWRQQAWAVRQAAGPWPREAAWWTPDPVLREEWDLELGHGALIRIFRERTSGAWFWDGSYD